MIYDQSPKWETEPDTGTGRGTVRKGFCRPFSREMYLTVRILGTGGGPVANGKQSAKGKPIDNEKPYFLSLCNL